MKTRQFIFDSLRSHLKARHLTYRHIAEKLGVSEQTVKRLFLQQDCSIERLEDICDLLQLDLRDLIKSSPRPRKFLQQLSLKQEELLAQNPRLLMVAVCAMSLWTFQDMCQHLNIPETETAALLHQLDKMGFLDLMPGNRYRLHVAREFSWIVGGPIMHMVRNMADGHHPWAGAIHSSGSANRPTKEGSAMNRPSKQSGQTSMEYVVVCAALAVALGVGMADDGSVLLQLLQAFRTAYQRISYGLAIAL